MSKFKASNTSDFLNQFDAWLNRFWGNLKWWQKLLLGGIYQELKEYLDELRLRVAQLRKNGPPIL